VVFVRHRWLFLLLAVLAACDLAETQETDAEARERMVRTQIVARAVRDGRVLDAMLAVPRHLFVPDSVRDQAYEDRPLPIGHDQTISQPYIVALMTDLAAVAPTDRVLEIGTGSGYQAAVLSMLARDVHTIELNQTLGDAAAKRLTELGYKNVHPRVGDGYLGWPEAAPFDAIVVTAAPEQVPEALIQQLKAEEGRMVIPVGPVGGVQELEVIEKDADGRLHRRSMAPVRFVPMIKK
jgi:protein-L-isoaspartate(D-aspartate) O-methyltransferase